LIGEFHPHPVPLRCHRNRTPERAVRNAAHNDFGGRISYAPQANDPHGLITGGRVIGRINGVDRDDQWAGTAVDFPFLPHADTTALEVVTYVPDSMAETGTLTVHLDGQPSGPFPVTKGRCAITVPAALSATTPTLIKLTADWCTTPTPGSGADARPLSYVLVGIQAT
ncbi:MAG TPA: SAM-dependent methyltransferase, partial [Pseudonocardiaceae bacterium]|nr:SAM-dependent methyltransferase [Pseudonocardiaceae bacterium]